MAAGTLFGREVNWDKYEDVSWEVPPGTYESYISPEAKNTGWINLPNAGERFCIRYVIDDPAFPKLKGRNITSYADPNRDDSMSYLKNDIKKILGVAELPPDLSPEILFGRRVRIMVINKEGKDGRVHPNVRVLGQGAAASSAMTFGSSGFTGFQSSDGARLGGGGLSGEALRSADGA